MKADTVTMSTIKITLPSVMKKWATKHAAAQGYESVSAYIGHLIAADMRRATIVEFERITQGVSDRAAAQGLTEEKLDMLMRDSV